MKAEQKQNEQHQLEKIKIMAGQARDTVSDLQNQLEQLRAEHHQRCTNLINVVNDLLKAWSAQAEEVDAIL